MINTIISITIATVTLSNTHILRRHAQRPQRRGSAGLQRQRAAHLRCQMPSGLEARPTSGARHVNHAAKDRSGPQNAVARAGKDDCFPPTAIAAASEEGAIFAFYGAVAIGGRVAESLAE